MQFRLHINDTNDGTVIARELRRLASEIDGQRLQDGFRCDINNGHAVMQIAAAEYLTCAEAERRFGATLQWTKNSTHHVGHYTDKPVAKVRRKA